ncbi:hypothetical protein [Pseudomonas phage D6]|nr:hypothetical protein [Pseudomonas phage D6]
MACSKLAIVRGEWQLDPDQTIRLYVRPTLEIIDRNGDTQYVSAFAATDGRSNPTRDESSGSFVCTPTNPCDASGGSERLASVQTYGCGLESLTPDLNIHMLGELSNDSSPIMAAVVLKSAIQWHVATMDPSLVCITDTVETNQYDGQIIEILSRMKVGNVERY